MKFLDKEMGTLGKRIRTLFKKQGITIISILTALGITLGVLIETLLGGHSMSTSTSQSATISDKKGGARKWIKDKLKALLQLLGKLADKALASLPGIIGSIISEFVGSYNRCRSLDLHIFHDKDKEEMSHLSVHHTVKTAVIPNTKATFSSS